MQNIEVNKIWPFEDHRYAHVALGENDFDTPVLEHPTDKEFTTVHFV